MNGDRCFCVAQDFQSTRADVQETNHSGTKYLKLAVNIRAHTSEEPNKYEVRKKSFSE